MERSLFLHKVRSLAEKGLRHGLSVARNLYFWGGLAALVVIFLAGYLLMDDLVMPAYTRHDTTIEVPRVLDLPYDEAAAALDSKGLRAQQLLQRFNPDQPRDVVVDQNPAPDTDVKPGRFVYLTINTGEVQQVTVPSVLALSLREAKARLLALGLTVDEERPDSIPSPHRNTVTRQKPTPLTSVPAGSKVTLWYSTGLGQQYVTIPDVTGMTVGAARAVLLNRRLRAVVVGAEANYEGLGEVTVRRQSREPGTRVREGFELRLFLQDE